MYQNIFTLFQCYSNLILGSKDFDHYVWPKRWCEVVQSWMVCSSANSNESLTWAQSHLCISKHPLGKEWWMDCMHWHNSRGATVCNIIQGVKRIICRDNQEWQCGRCYIQRSTRWRHVDFSKSAHACSHSSSPSQALKFNILKLKWAFVSNYKWIIEWV